jgi:hypothetical protein
MKYLCLTLGLSLFFCFPVFAAELLVGDEQSFESGPVPGRWVEFTWPDNTAGGQRPSPFGGGSEGASGDPVNIAQVADATTTFGSNCLAIYGNDGGGTFPDVGGIRITVDVVNGATYTVSAHIKFATDVSGYNAAGGISIDTDGGIDPLALDYGYNDGDDGTVDPRNEFDPIRASDPTFGGPDWLIGEWAWNESFINGPGLEEQWWGPSLGDEFTVDVQATGNRMTIFLWGFDKFNGTAVLFDGISVDGPDPTPSAGTEDWEKYR